MSAWRCALPLTLLLFGTGQPGLERFKIVVQCVVGQIHGQGSRIASRCLWDADNDNDASVSFKNVRWVSESGSNRQNEEEDVTIACLHTSY